MKISFRQKILTGFIICAVILFAIVYYSLHNSRKFVDSSKWVAHTHEVIYEFEQLLASSVDMESSVRGFLIASDPLYLQTFETAREDIWQHLNKVQTLSADNTLQQKNIDQLRLHLEKRIDFHHKLIETYKTDTKQAEAIFATAAGRQLQEQLRGIVNSAIDAETELLSQRKALAENDARRFNTALLVLVFVGVIILGGILFIIISNFRALHSAEMESTEKNWLLTGSVELNEAIRGQPHVDIIAQTAIEYLCTYLKAQVGIIYLEENGEFKLKGTYAFQPTENERVSFRTGEGLIGQAALEKRIILFKEVPEDYILIKSGLAKGVPKNIAAIPLLMNESVKAVIEIGMARNVSELEISFLELVRENLSTTITIAQSQAALKELLEETQRQAEELEAQQEELRQTNERLQENMGLLERSELELRMQQEELQQSNKELEKKANLLEIQKEELGSAKLDIESKATELEVTGRYKSEFLANMSHELRTPLNSILILSQILFDNKTGVLSGREVEMSKNIHHAGQDLLQLINEILDLSKIESGKLELEINPVSLTDITSEIQGTFSEIAKSKSIDFTVSNEINGEISLVTDESRLKQILKNLLSNAFKFTPPDGKVSLLINKADSSEIRLNKPKLNGIKHLISFSVIDTGIGIPEDKLDIIFEAFRQADGSTRRRYGGTGLGLSISKELAGALGGSLQVKSAEGEGSVFILYLPEQFDLSVTESTNRVVGMKEKPPVHTAIKNDVNQQIVAGENVEDDRYVITEKDKVILIMEDDFVFGKLLLDFVRERNYKGIVASQGNTGFSLAGIYKPDAIILDMELPVMKGEEVLARLKADTQLKHIPVQIISGYDRKRKSLELGAIDFIRKPVSREELKGVFDKVEGLISKKIKKLLIVEDNEQQNIAIRELIGNNDVKSYAAFSGAEAYEMMIKEEFDCVIVDLGLPDIPGIELIEKIRQNEQLSMVPVIVYTGKEVSKEEHARLLKSVNTVVLKTTDSQERLLDETMLFLNRVESMVSNGKPNGYRQPVKSEEILKYKKVLLVDDDIRNVYSLTNVLEEQGMECLTAENGRIALEILQEHPGISIVLMDIMMPEMDGYETTRRIRSMNEFLQLPVIAITAKAMKGDRAKCLEAGMNDYISKPVDIDQLLSLMKVWLHQ